MSKNDLYIPLKVVPYIFISITVIAITAAKYVITQSYQLFKVLDIKLIKIFVLINYMNKVKITIFTISIIIFSLFGIKKLIHINQVKDLKNKEESFLNESIRVLNECFDLENKNKRTLNKSIELIEYCLEEYGYKN